MLSRQKPYTLRKIIDYIRKKIVVDDKEYQLYQDDDWCVYSADTQVSMKSVCYIDDYADINDSNEEVPTEFVQQNGLKFVYTSELLTDVITNALYQNEFADNDLIFKALEYYNEYDDFMDIKSAPVKKTKYSVILKSVGSSKIRVLKALSELLGIGVGEAKNLLTDIPVTLKVGISREEAEKISEILTRAGAEVKLK